MNTKHTIIASAAALALLQIALIADRLLGHIHWSWWWVLTPLWLPVVAVVVIAIIAVALFAGAESQGENPFQ